jgi:peptidoglycan/LPS O-acetylase OafA/YrhL
LGCIPTVLGAGVVLLGSAYALAEWRYGGAVLIWSLMWGLMLVGLGMAVMATGRRWMASLGVAACSISALLVFAWERTHSLESWPFWIYPGDAIGVLIGLVVIMPSTWRRRS